MDSQNGWEVLSNDGGAYGPASDSIAWGHRGCPILPRFARDALSGRPLPDYLREMLGRQFATYDELGVDAIERAGLEKLPDNAAALVARSLNPRYLPQDAVAIPSGIPTDWIDLLPLSRRVFGVVRRYAADDVKTRHLTVEKFLHLRGAGLATLLEATCVLESVELHTPVTRTRHKPHERDELQETSPALKSLLEFSRWARAETASTTLADAMREAASCDDPPHAWAALATLELSDISDPTPHPCEVLNEWAETQLDSRERDVFRCRIAFDTGVTLRELGDRHGVSRERVRQLQERVRNKVQRFYAEETASLPIRWRVETLRRVIGVAAPLDEVERLLRPPPGIPDCRAFLLSKAGLYAVEGDWLILESEAHAAPDVGELCDEMGIIDRAAAAVALSEWGLPPSRHKAWLSNQRRVREFGGRLALWGASVADRLAFALDDLGEPATIDEMMAHVSEKTTRNSALNALALDGRFVKINQAEYALSTWDFLAYDGIAESMRNLLEDAGRPMPIGEVVDYMRRNFGSAETSVRWYCDAPMFVAEDGMIRLRAEDEPYHVEPDSLRRTRGVFELGPLRVALLLEVDDNILRGSGRALTRIAGDLLGVAVNDRIELTSGGGDSVSLTFPETSNAGPLLGSVRAFAERLSAKRGDWLTLTLDTLDLSVEAALTKAENVSPCWRIVGRLSGIEPRAGLDALASSLRCEPHEARDVLRARGDAIVLSAMPGAERRPLAPIEPRLIP